MRDYHPFRLGGGARRIHDDRGVVRRDGDRFDPFVEGGPRGHEIVKKDGLDATAALDLREENLVEHNSHHR